MSTTLFVLTERGSRAEAAEAREIWQGRSIAVGTASGHLPGQRLNGDVVVIGPGAPTAEQDATGEVKRYVSLATARAAHKRAAEPHETPPPAAPAPPHRTMAQKPESTADEEASAPDEPPDPTEGMSRVEMIQEAARRWPGARQWANMSNDDLRAAFREMGTGD